jgi:hypothetical protein
MPLVRTGETAWEKEEQRWNDPKRIGGMNADGFEPFPKMLYKAALLNGKAVLTDPFNEGFAARCQRIVHSEDEERAAKAQGWVEGPNAALEAFEAEQRKIADAAAEANWQAKRMSPKAQAERASREAATDQHVPE